MQSNHVSSNCSMAWYVIVGTFSLPMTKIPIATIFYCPKIVGKEHTRFWHWKCIKMIHLPGVFVMGNSGTSQYMFWGGSIIFAANGKKDLSSFKNCKNCSVTGHKVQLMEAHKKIHLSGVFVGRKGQGNPICVLEGGSFFCSNYQK